MNSSSLFCKQTSFGKQFDTGLSCSMGNFKWNNIFLHVWLLSLVTVHTYVCMWSWFLLGKLNIININRKWQFFSPQLKGEKKFKIYHRLYIINTTLIVRQSHSFNLGFPKNILDLKYDPLFCLFGKLGCFWKIPCVFLMSTGLCLHSDMNWVHSWYIPDFIDICW